MNRLDAFCDDEARRAAARPTLAEALLAGRAWGYAWYRVRYLLARVPIRTALHLAEVFLLGAVFPLEELGPIFAIRAVLSVAAALHWGALEPLRQEVRDAASRRAWTRAIHTIRLWFGRSLALAALELLLAVLWVTFAPSEFRSFSIFDAYALAAGLRLALETVTRTYASGVGALQRIPRPFWAGLPGDAIDLCGALLLFPWFGAWSFALSLLTGGVVRSALLFVYARRAYRRSKLRRLALRWPLRRVRGRRGRIGLATTRSALAHALANAISQLDAWIVLALSAAARTEADAVVVAALHVLRPLLTASIGWARLFYLDFKQLEVKGRLLQARFERLLRRLGLAFAAAAGLVLLALFPLFAEDAGNTPWLLLPFLVVRSFLSLYQTQAFSYGRLRPLVVLSIFVACGLAIVPRVPYLATHALAAVTLGLGALLAVVRWPRGASRGVVPRVVGLYRWLDALSATKEPVRIGAGIASRSVAVPAHRVAAELARRPDVVAASWGTRHVLWFVRGAAALETDAAHRSAIISATGGCLDELRLGPQGDGGRDALVRALEANVLERTLADRLRAARSSGVRALTEDFRRRFPLGLLLDENGGRMDHRTAAPEARTATPLRRALGEVLRLAEGPGSRRARDVPAHLSVYSPGGEPIVVFVLPHATDSAESAAWRRRVEDENLAASAKV